ncbi:hypothetical protein EIP91_000110 [Steccherinum ochraceum]|uniref:UDP-glycosyltransferases domain-containing protein n=1 Tax=Steccherinum ochraceum TaxID=92696 RepID=A0A4R0S2U0_9APHY|nr:hypothetical protein EIP91_000110 [Steccherinum ochraceum]
MTSVQQYPHLVIAGAEPWGHTRPICAFAAKVVLLRDIHVTFFTIPRILDRVKNEVDRGFRPEDAERRKLIRIFAVDCSIEEPMDIIDKIRAEQTRYFEQFITMYKQLLNQGPVTCAVTKATFESVPAPKILVIDFINGPLAKMVHSLPNNHAKVVGFCSGMASFQYLWLAPANRGGRGDLKADILREAERSGRPVVDVADDMVHAFTDEVVQMPGLPKMYHWEFDPQECLFVTKGFVGGMWMSFFETYEECDGLILTTPEAYEPAAVAATKEWFADTKRDVWAIGPLFPSLSSQEAIAGETAQSKDSGEIKIFMDDVLARHGQHSMIYISFGSVFWTSELNKLEAFIDVIIERNIPFILSHGSPLAQLTDTFKAKVEQSGLGLLSAWSPQQTILAHPALGWFVSHCGHNSALEAVSSGTPVICWPFHADQPANAINLTEIHDVAYELLEVRTGNELKPIYRTGKAVAGTLDAIRAEAREVLEKAFGEDGARKRANVEKLLDNVHAAWNPDGPATQDMISFLDNCTGQP